MQRILAIDAGGTSTRAAIFTDSGICLGIGKGGSGNPLAVGATIALDSILTATRNALCHAGEPAVALSGALIAMAGASPELSSGRLEVGLAPLGLTGDAIVAPDLLATYFSGSIMPTGFALVAGTGSIAARVAEGQLDRVAGGTGWLLGDSGAGFWIGRRVVRAVAGDLDGVLPATALTRMLMDSLEIYDSHELRNGRPAPLASMVEKLYALRPVELARFAPIAFAATGDAVAEGILLDAAAALVSMLGAVRMAGSEGPVVLGGGLLSSDSVLLAALTAALGTAELIRVPDGIVGAGVLGLRQAGMTVDEPLFQRLRQQVAGLGL